MKAVRTLTINFFVLALLLEVGSLLYVEIAEPAISPYDRMPTYLHFGRKDIVQPRPMPECPHVIDTLLPWSFWHSPNHVFRQTLECSDITMDFNRLGCRGNIPDSSDARNVLFIGDSFTEGWGVREDSTIPAQFSRMTGMPTLNLGCSGFGTTQMALVYKNFASRFRHSRAYVLTYLNNDFRNNDIRDYSDPSSPEYHRYATFRRDTSHLDSIVHLGDPSESLFSWAEFNRVKKAGVYRFKRMGWDSLLKSNHGSVLKSLCMLTYSMRTLSIAQNAFHDMKRGKIAPDIHELDYDDWDWKVLRKDIEDMMKTADANKASIVFMNIPDYRLLEAARRDPRVASQYRLLEKRLESDIAARGHRMVSFFEQCQKAGIPIDGIRIPCDNHYNERGDRMVAEYLAGEFYSEKPVARIYSSKQ